MGNGNDTRIAEEGWSLLGPEFVEGVLHVLGIDRSGLGESGGRQGVVGDAVDLPG